MIEYNVVSADYCINNNFMTPALHILCKVPMVCPYSSYFKTLKRIHFYNKVSKGGQAKAKMVNAPPASLGRNSNAYDIRAIGNMSWLYN